MDKYIKGMRSLTLVSVLVFFAALTFRASQDRRVHDLQQVEKLFLAASLLRAHRPQTARIPVSGMETEFVEGSPDDPEYLNRSGKVLDLIKDWNANTYNFAGQVILENGEAVNFVRLEESRWPEHLSDVIGKCRESDQAKAEEAVTYQVYSVESPAFRGQTLRLVFADGLVSWMHFDYLKTSGWLWVDTWNGAAFEATHLDSNVQRLAERWVGAVKQPEISYLSLRAQHSQANITVPILNLDVSEAHGALLITLIALCVGGLLTHTAHGLESHATEGAGEAWVVIPPATTDPLSRATVILLSWVGIAAVALTLLLPTLAAGLCAMAVTNSWARALLYSQTAAAGLLAALALRSFGRFVVNSNSLTARSSGGHQEQS